MAILFLFTISCSLTSVVLAALSADVGGSFSILYEPQQPARGKAVLQKEDLQQFESNLREIAPYTDDSNSRMLVAFDYWDGTDALCEFTENPSDSWEDFTDYATVTSSGITIGFYEIIDQIYMDFLYVLCDDDIYLPEDSTSFFDGIFSAEPYYLFFNNLHTDDVKIADKMFAHCDANLNLSEMNFSNVTSADGMFENCRSEHVFVSESILTNENINNQIGNSNLYNATHNESGKIHMTIDSQFVLPGIDLTKFGEWTEEGYYLPLSDQGDFVINFGDAYGIGFDKYTFPGTYIDKNGKRIAWDYYTSLYVEGDEYMTELISCPAITTESADKAFIKKKRVGFYIEYDIFGNPKLGSIYFISDGPIYLINAPRPEDEYGGLLDFFKNKDDPSFSTIFNNFDTRFWG